MLFIIFIILGIVIGLLLKGDIRKIDVTKLRYPYIAIGAFGIEVILFTLVRKDIIQRGMLTYIPYLFQYFLILFFVYLNRKNFGLLTIGLGIFLNALVIFLNGGAMPVSPEGLVKTGIAPSIDAATEGLIAAEGLYTVITSETLLPFLGDVIPFWRYVMSIGDVFIFIGVMVYIITEMKS
ncbi:DUF5317 domain-containing protein [Anaerobranca gottschalkii]|uniref:DUF5317 domain-containing protein n=1 Tax=Anaerobranca gottschalkii DSM 13577 TaxID=1120990 RepID=A0A1I0BY11_9FIRM|nr:DUF5317 domain-containing protein [Anaerobranca gottschalkii]SET11416.1 hypothetical protein SAMN03080614_105013 [Anaerobranca gottschalkii DSM 13577]